MKNRFVQVLVLTIIVIATISLSQHAFAQAEPLRGTVVSKTDKGIKEVQVILRAPGSNEAIEEHTTDEEGRFSLAMESLRPGYEIHLYKDGYDDVVLPINPQQLVVANIRVIMLRTKTKPTKPPTIANADAAKPTPKHTVQVQGSRQRAVSLYNEAVEQFEEDKPEEKKAAELKVRQAASMDPDFAEPLRFLGRLAMQRQNWAEASRYSEALIRIDPKDEEAIRDLYVSLVIMRHFKRVGEAAKLLIAFDQENILHVERHAQEFFKNDQIVMARALYEALSEIAPDPINAYLNLGICCTSLGDVEGTRAAFEAFIEIAPEDHPDLESVRRDLAGLDAPVAPEAQGAPEAPE